MYEREKDMKGIASTPPFKVVKKSGFCELDICIPRFEYLTDTAALPYE